MERAKRHSIYLASRTTYAEYSPAYAKTLAEGAVVMFDDSLVPPAELDPARLAPVPILRCAKETVGKAFTANIVAVGAINAALRLFDDACLLEAVRRHIPAGTEEINKKALDAGAALIAAEDGR